MPTAVQPLKAHGPHAIDINRVEMLRLATGDEPAWRVCTLEVEARRPKLYGRHIAATARRVAGGGIVFFDRRRCAVQCGALEGTAGNFSAGDATRCASAG